MTAGAKKIIIAGVAVAAIAAGAFGYHAYYHKRTVPTAHTGYQMSGGVMAMDGERIMMDALARQLAGVQTAAAEKRALTKEIKTTGKIALNENGRTYITSRVEGRADEVYVTSEGAYIASGEAIAAVYSPTYIAAQEEYLLALDNVEKLQGASRDLVQINNRLLDAAERKMLLLGIPEEEVAHLAHTRQVNTYITVRAPFGGTVMERLLLPGAYVMPGDKLYALADLSSVWLYADIYEKDIASVQPGQPVMVTTTAYPGENFSGQVTFINPVVDDATRTVKVRVEMPNPDGKLKPNMFVNAAIRVPLGESVVIPASALLDTGTRKIVFVQESEDTFVKRDIVTGQEAEGYIQVLSGLNPGDVVVTQATFLIDSQTKLGSFGGHGGHGGGHGDTAPQNMPAPSDLPAETAPAPGPAALPSPGSGEHGQHGGEHGRH